MIVDYLQSSEINRVLEIFNESRLDTDGLSSAVASLADLQSLLEGECTFVAKIDGKACGFVSVWADDNFVHHLYVMPQFQSQGIGSALLKKCQDRFGLPLRLKCDKSNHSARHYYESAGWVQEGEDLGPDGPYINYRLGV